jgi:hypothetical protein
MPAPARAKKPTIEEPSLEERIRRRAYELYVQRGNESGSEFDDWLQAEEEIQRAEEHAVGKSRLTQRKGADYARRNQTDRLLLPKRAG